MEKKPLPLSEVHRLLEPGPVVLLTTTLSGKANIMTMSWHTMMEFDPPTIGCVISDKDYTFNILKTTKECAINVPTVEIAEQVVGCGNTTGEKTDKFKIFNLTPVTASLVKAPLVSECYANIECKVINTEMVTQYGFFILEAVGAWINPSKKYPRTIHHLGKGNFMVAGKIIKLLSNMK